MKRSVGPVEIGYEVGPWLRVSRYEIGVGRYLVYNVEAIPYIDADGTNRSVTLSEEPKWRPHISVRGRRTYNDDKSSWSLIINSRTLYLTVDPR